MPPKMPPDDARLNENATLCGGFDHVWSLTVRAVGSGNIWKCASGGVTSVRATLARVPMIHSASKASGRNTGNERNRIFSISN